MKLNWWKLLSLWRRAMWCYLNKFTLSTAFIVSYHCKKTLQTKINRSFSDWVLARTRGSVRPLGGGPTDVDVLKGSQASTVKFQIVCIWVNSFQKDLKSRNLIQLCLIFFNSQKETSFQRWYWSHVNYKQVTKKKFAYNKNPYFVVIHQGLVCSPQYQPETCACDPVSPVQCFGAKFIGDICQTKSGIVRCLAKFLKSFGHHNGIQIASFSTVIFVCINFCSVQCIL